MDRRRRRAEGETAAAAALTRGGGAGSNSTGAEGGGAGRACGSAEGGGAVARMATYACCCATKGGRWRWLRRTKGEAVAAVTVATTLTCGGRGRRRHGRLPLHLGANTDVVSRRRWRSRRILHHRSKPVEFTLLCQISIKLIRIYQIWCQILFISFCRKSFKIFKLI